MFYLTQALPSTGLYRYSGENPMDDRPAATKISPFKPDQLRGTTTAHLLPISVTVERETIAAWV